MLGSSWRRLCAALANYWNGVEQDIDEASKRRQREFLATVHLEVLEHELTDIINGIGSWSEVTQIDPRFPRMFVRWRSHVRETREDLNEIMTWTRGEQDAR